MKYWPVILIAALALSTSSCKGGASAAASTKEKGDHLWELFQLMQGSFNNTAQAASDKTYHDITLHLYPIWQNLEGEPKWLYMEQSMTATPKRPFRQNVYKLYMNDTGEYVSETYTLPRPGYWVMAWKDSRKWDALRPEELEIQKGCEVVLERLGQGHFKGGTNTDNCGNTLRRGGRATTKMEITPGKIIRWDRGFDDAGQQVSGPADGPYVFLKMANGR